MTAKKPARRSSSASRSSSRTSTTSGATGRRTSTRSSTSPRSTTQRTTTRGSTPRRTTTRGTTTRRTTTRRSTTTRRRQPKLATTVGAALATLLVTTFTSMSWPARLGVIALVVVAGLAWMLWSHRAEIRAGAAGEPADHSGPADDSDLAHDATTDDLTADDVATDDLTTHDTPSTAQTDPAQEPTP